MRQFNAIVNERVAILQKQLRDETGISDLRVFAQIPPQRTPVEVIIEAVCEYTGITYIEVLKRCRLSRYVLTRQLIAYYLREEHNLCYQAIADKLRLQNHTSAMVAVKKVHRFISGRDEVICDAILAINEKIEMKK